jgi:hypothetical protein
MKGPPVGWVLGCQFAALPLPLERSRMRFGGNNFGASIGQAPNRRPTASGFLPGRGYRTCKCFRFGLLGYTEPLPAQPYVGTSLAPRLLYISLP